MSEPRWTKLDEALPPPVVEAIWAEVHATTTPSQLRDMLKAFVRIALCSPHLASQKEIAAALGEPTNKITPLAYEVRREARLTRGTSHDSHVFVSERTKPCSD